MKKLIYICAMILVLGACVKEQAPSLPEVEEGKVKVDFSVLVPDAQVVTKAMGETPQLRNLYLAVFDEAGYLAEYVKADPEKTEYATENGTIYKYSITLSLSDTPRTIHWIGNAPESVMYGSEESVMMGMMTSGNEDAYWYRKVVDKVDAVSVEDGIKASDELIAALSNIPLIRNFAKIVLVDNTETFELESYTVVNTLKEAYTVAYDFGKGEFKEYMGTDGQPKTYQQLIQEGYNASVPTAGTYISLSEAMNKTVGAGQAYYVYEREKPLSTPAYIMAYGKYAGATESSYYKINLRDNNGEYFPLLRNFQYTVSLDAVYRNGYATPEEAAASTGSGDVSTALETETLIYMSDGSASLEVAYSDIVVMTDDPIALKFKFYPDLTDAATLYKGAETGYFESMEFFINDDAGITGAAVASVSQPDYTSDPVIYVTPTAPGDAPKSQTVTILAKYTPKNTDIPRTLQRKVKFTVMNPQLMNVECVPTEVPNLQGTKFNVDITIPAGLSRGMFPLDFKVEAKNLCITPDLDFNQMTIETGKSLVNSTKPAYFFTKKLSWSDYQSLASIDGRKLIKAYFETTKSASATEIYVGNEYFYGNGVDGQRLTYAATYLGNYMPLYFGSLVFNPSSVPAGVDVKVQFSFTLDEIPEDGKVILAMQNVAPDENEEKLTKKTVVCDVTQYECVVNEAGTHTFDLITLSADGEPKISLSAHHFIEASAIAPRN